MMWSAFKKQKEVRISPKYYLLIRDKWVKKMDTLALDLSKKSLVFFLILFVVIAGMICMYNVYKGFLSTYSSPAKIGIVSNSIHFNKKFLLKKTNQMILSKTEYENFTRFRFYLDSLRQFPEGKRVYDSISYCRPGLIDSLDFIENYYKTNYKK
jgi:hypothetical protein